MLLLVLLLCFIGVCVDGWCLFVVVGIVGFVFVGLDQRLCFRVLLCSVLVGRVRLFVRVCTCGLSLVVGLRGLWIRNRDYIVCLFFVLIVLFTQHKP